jgi:hypothetical protein
MAYRGSRDSLLDAFAIRVVCSNDILSANTLVLASRLTHIAGRFAAVPVFSSVHPQFPLAK